MNFSPGFYCATTEKIFPVDYADIPDTRIYTAGKFVKKLDTLLPGKRIYGEFDLCDLDAWFQIPDRLKMYEQRQAVVQAFKDGLRPSPV